MKNAPDTLKKDPFYILEKSSVHLAVGDYLAVWRGIYDLFYLGGEDFINYVFAAQLAINMKEFEHAVEVFRVAEEKHEVNLLKQDLTGLDDGASLLIRQRSKSGAVTANSTVSTLNLTI
ncbi:hypothetical protein N478_10290 [Pseudoalteromonas luteoviolacea S4060-1]|uniref:Uncharacterized protein n=1 Tax=Pseudoalteromonas luteoviolacea S4060-1 TaxID=1365257 RepID=A0A162CL53_9GAMM|nr:hypothetical protein N478_10290 [Pseudoalteromonas luteoviolacea S4060-1]